MLACADTPEESFVAQYAGEVINNREADERLKAYDAEPQAIGHALLVRLSCVSANRCAAGVPALPRKYHLLLTCSPAGKPKAKYCDHRYLL